jgi:hypothetical protein
MLICYTLKNNLYNHLVGGPVVRARDQEVSTHMISSSSLVVVNMMATKDLYGR